MDDNIQQSAVRRYRIDTQKQLDDYFAQSDHVEIFKADFRYGQDIFKMDYGYGCFSYMWFIVEIIFNNILTRYAIALNNIKPNELKLFKLHCQCDYCLSWGPMKMFYATTICFKTSDPLIGSWDPNHYNLFRKTRAYLRKKDLI